MLRFMLDTNVCIHVMRRRGSPIEAKMKVNGNGLCISTITVHELLHGAVRSNRPDEQHALTYGLISRLVVLDFDTAAAQHSGEIHATLAGTGRIIGAYDLLIAGHARSRGLVVVTNNTSEFSRVQGLVCEDWLAA